MALGVDAGEKAGGQSPTATPVISKGSMAETYPGLSALQRAPSLTNGNAGRRNPSAPSIAAPPARAATATEGDTGTWSPATGGEGGGKECWTTHAIGKAVGPTGAKEVCKIYYSTIQIMQEIIKIIYSNMTR